MLRRFLQRLHNAIAITAVFHINQVEHNNAAQIAQPNLPYDLFDRFEVGSGNRVFQSGAAAADKLSGVNVDCHQRLSLIDYEISAGLEPDTRLDRLVDFGLNTIRLENRLIASVKLYPLDHAGLDPVDEFNDPQIFLFRVDPDRGEVVGELIPQDTLNQIQVLVNNSRSLAALGRLPNIQPCANKITGVVAQVFFADAGSGSSYDKAA